MSNFVDMFSIKMEPAAGFCLDTMMKQREAKRERESFNAINRLMSADDEPEQTNNNKKKNVGVLPSTTTTTTESDLGGGAAAATLSLDKIIIHDDGSNKVDEDSDSFSDIDDKELDVYLHTEEEKVFKKIIWETMNTKKVPENNAENSSRMVAF